MGHTKQEIIKIKPDKKCELILLFDCLTKYKPHKIKITAQMIIKTSLFKIPHSWIKSTLDKNLKARANSINPKTTFIEFVHDPDLGSLLITLGKKANKVKGIESAIPKPSIPYVKSIAPPSFEILPTSKVPKIGPVHEKETKTSVKAMKKVENKPVYILDLLSVLVVQELGKVKSKRPNNDNAKTINIMKNKKFKIGLVEIWFNISGLILSKK